MKRNLLIHSMGEFASITLPILDAINAKVICEIGAEHGGNSKVIAEWLHQHDGKLISIDPNPSNAFTDLLSSVDIEYIAKLSHAAIPDVSGADAWFVDGDHNWYTVYYELIKIRDVSRQDNKPIVIFLHDVGWPCERRDMYYSPNDVPDQFRHPYTWDKGVTLDQAETIDGGFRSNGQFAIALKEGGPRNGVLTAVEDFMQLHPEEFCFANVPAVFGLGILYDVNHPKALEIAKIVAPYHDNALLRRLELNRLDNYLKVIQFQDEATKKIVAPTSNAQSHHASKQPKSPQAEHKTQYPSESQLSTVLPYAQQQEFEKMVIEIANVLADEKDHPEVWALLSEYNTPDKKSELKLFTDYLSKLVLIPQEATTLKILSLLEVMCFLHTDRVDLAQKKLRSIAIKHSQCLLVRGVLIQVGKAYVTSN